VANNIFDTTQKTDDTFHKRLSTMQDIVDDRLKFLDRMVPNGTEKDAEKKWAYLLDELEVLANVQLTIIKTHNAVHKLLWFHDHEDPNHPGRLDRNWQNGH